ncbi:MAG: GNAT family N-acetyltransferase [Candidatus Hydrogenedentes bacterium]|nr:GNAT family N-acetyltransferase [Candidatus Hydrogenedentota bacterium]
MSTQDTKTVATAHCRVAARGDGALLEAFALRYRVFAHEQNVTPEIELDDEDRTAAHCVAEMDGRVVGTLRILDRPGYTKIGRVAVDAAWRKHGIGQQIMEFAHAVIRERHAPQVVLHAQTAVRRFYERLGYTVCGEEFLEDGIAHIEMRKRLD